MFLLLFLGSFLILVMSPPWLDTFPPYFSGSSSTALPRVLAPAWRIRSEGTDLPQDNTTTCYSFSHNHGSGKWLNLKGNDCWRDPFILLPWLLGGRIPTLPKSEVGIPENVTLEEEIPNLEAIIFSCQPLSICCVYQSNYATQGRIELRNNWWINICQPKMCAGSWGGLG